MSQKVYTTGSPLEIKAAETVVITCSARELQQPVAEFVEQGLGVERGAYFLLAVPGGPQLLSMTEYLPKFAWVGSRWLRFLAEKGGVRRAILIGHQGCLWYQSSGMVAAVQHLLNHEKSIEDRQRDDLLRVVAAVHAALPGVAAEPYFATSRDDGRLDFTRI